jgi:NodT family efflux transporter outer membrane factor (OMF) lipoprotein
MKNAKFFLSYLSLVFAVFLAACSTDNEFKSPIKDQVQADFLTDSTKISNSAPTDNWWMEFNDPTLNHLVELGLANNKDIQIASADIATSRDLNSIQVSALLPSASVYAGRQRFASPAFGPNGVKYDIYQSGFDAAWELDFLGKNLDRSRAGKLRFLEEVQIYKATALSIAGEISRNYIELRSAEKQIANLQEIIAAHNQIIASVNRKEKSGTAAKTDIYNATINLGEATSHLADLQTIQKVSTYKLAVLIGKTPDQISEILKDSKSNQIINYQSGIVPVGLKSDILRRRPDIIAAEYEIDAAVFDKKAQLKEFFPSFNLTANIGGGASNLGDVFKNGANVKNIQGFVSVPIFEGGRLIAEYKISKNKAKVAVLNYENTVLKALEECESGLVRYVNSLQSESATESQFKASASIFKISQNKKRLGVISGEDLFGAQIAMLKMENQLVIKKQQTLTNLIAFHKAIGGGFEGYEMKFEKDQVLWAKK